MSRRRKATPMPKQETAATGVLSVRRAKGIAFSRIAAENIRDGFLGKNNSDAHFI